MSPEPRTVWRIRGLEDLRTGERQPLDVELVVDTTAPAVVDVIERAAHAAGVDLERVEPELEP